MLWLGRGAGGCLCNPEKEIVWNQILKILNGVCTPSWGGPPWGSPGHPPRLRALPALVFSNQSPKWPAEKSVGVRSGGVFPRLLAGARLYMPLWCLLFRFETATLLGTKTPERGGPGGGSGNPGSSSSAQPCGTLGRLALGASVSAPVSRPTALLASR